MMLICEIYASMLCISLV